MKQFRKGVSGALFLPIILVSFSSQALSINVITFNGTAPEGNVALASGTTYLEAGYSLEIE